MCVWETECRAHNCALSIKWCCAQMESFVSLLERKWIRLSHQSNFIVDAVICKYSLTKTIIISFVLRKWNVRKHTHTQTLKMTMKMRLMIWLLSEDCAQTMTERNCILFFYVIVFWIPVNTTMCVSFNFFS